MTLAEDLPECLGAIFSCDDPTPNCRNSARFDFPTLWNITHQYREQCPSGPWLFRQPGVGGDVPDGEASLTNRICELIADATWKRYSNADVWYRLTTWKFPLFQLISISSRPPLGFWEEAFTIIHLLGDPIGSSTDLVRKIDSCQSRAGYWKYRLDDNKLRPKLQDHKGPHELYRRRLWKALALIITSYDEWGSDKGTSAERYLKEELFVFHLSISNGRWFTSRTTFCSETALKDDRNLFISLCLESASHLAADRSTKFLPVIIAQAFFIGSIVIAIIRTKSLAEGPNPQTYIDIEMYSIGFTALYFWVISAVTLTSVIGASQTANSIPNILTGFRLNLSKAFPQRNINLPQIFDAEERYRRGGIYSWQPDGASEDFFDNAAPCVQRLLTPTVPRNRRRSSTRVRLYQSWPWFCTVLPLLSVSFGTIIGMLFTSLVPPDGWSCRSIAEIAIFAVWLVSYPCTLIPWGSHHRRRFWFTFVKDFAAMAATLGLIIATQVGIFNKCSCYTRDGKTGLALPQNPMVKTNLEHRLELHYPAIVVTGIVAQLFVVPGIIAVRYYGAVRVFLQRDDGKSNLQWCSNIGNSTWWMTQRKAFKNWMKKKRSVRPAEEGCELGDVTHVDEAVTTLLGGGQDEMDRSKGAASHAEEVALKHDPRGISTAARGRVSTISGAAGPIEVASEAGIGRRIHKG